VPVILKLSKDEGLQNKAKIKFVDMRAKCTKSVNTIGNRMKLTNTFKDNSLKKDKRISIGTTGNKTQACNLNKSVPMSYRIAGRNYNNMTMGSSGM